MAARARAAFETTGTLAGGADAWRAALDGLLHRERALLADLDPDERRNLADLMRILLAPFDNELRLQVGGHS